MTIIDEIMKSQFSTMKRLDEIWRQDSRALVAKTNRALSRSVANSTFVNPEFDTVVIDSILPKRTFFPTNDYFIEVPVGGFWAYSFRLSFLSSSDWSGSESCSFYITVNGTARDSFREFPATNSSPVANGSGILELSADDAVTLVIFQNSGVTQTLQASTGGLLNSLCLYKLRGY